ncbi:MAG: hypothetical protein GKR87_05540 [Kiritimatiellae bacterium]|nr:hypothetical protein [Kiritimatiellia bacterium]
MDIEKLEENFLLHLEQPEIPVDSLVNTLTSIYNAGEQGVASSLSELLQETLNHQQKTDHALDVLEFRATHNSLHPESNKRAEKDLLSVLGNTPENRSVIKNIGLNDQLLVSESFRRLRLLRAFSPGVLCHDSTWGFGVIKNVDTFYEKVEIDFDKKSKHEMSFSYSAETLELIPESHLLAEKYHHPKKLQALIKEHPDQVVRWALKDYGPMSIAILQEKLVPSLVKETEWKRFWEGSRKELKKDPCVDIPSKRAEPILLLDTAKKYDEHWFSILSNTKKMEKILELIDEYIEQEQGADDFSETSKKILSDRLAFVVYGAELKQPHYSARAAITAYRLKVNDLDTRFLEHMNLCLQKNPFLKTVSSLPVRDKRPFMNLLLSLAQEDTLNLFLQILPQMDTSTLAETIELLQNQGREQECSQQIRAMMRKKQVNIEIVYWLWKNLDYLDKWSLGSVSDLADQILITLEEEHRGDRLKVQNQLSDKFKTKDSLQLILSHMSEKERNTLFVRIRDSMIWSSIDGRSILGHMVKMYPELQSVLTDHQSQDEGKKSSSKILYTSQRSYTERQNQLERIAKVEIPKNSKEIALARSYGDLKESHEYKAAKEMQAILIRREAEIEQMLEEVTPTEFENYPYETVGMATEVTLVYPDNHEEKYVILGVWDHDETLNIISSETRLAKALEGHQPGDQVVIPAESGEGSCVIKELETLSPQIREWIKSKS